MDGRAQDAYHLLKIIMCRQGRKWMSHLTKDIRVFAAYFCPDSYQHQTDNRYFSYWNLSPCLCFVHLSAPFFPHNFSHSVSWIPPPLLFFFLCTWEGDCLSRWDSEGKRNSKSNNNPNGLPHHHFPLIWQVTEGIPKDKTATGSNTSLNWRRLFPALSFLPAHTISRSHQSFLWLKQPDKSSIFGKYSQ